MQPRLQPRSDWPAHFYCPTTWLTFEPRGITWECTKSDSAAPRRHVKTDLLLVHRSRDMGNKSAGLTSYRNTTIMPFMTEDFFFFLKRHNGFTQPRLKRRVHPPPRAFLSLIRRASSCLRSQNPARRHNGGPPFTCTDFKHRKSHFLFNKLNL